MISVYTSIITSIFRIIYIFIYHKRSSPCVRFVASMMPKISFIQINTTFSRQELTAEFDELVHICRIYHTFLQM